MSFLRSVSGLSLRNRVRSSVIWEGLTEELLCLHIQSSQLRWYRQLIRMPLGFFQVRCFGNVLGDEEAPGQIQDILDLWAG